MRASVRELAATTVRAHRREEDRGGRVVCWGGGIAATRNAARAVVRVEYLVEIEARWVGAAANERGAETTVFVRGRVVVGSSRIGAPSVQAVCRGDVGVQHVVDRGRIEAADHRFDAAAWQVSSRVVVARGRLDAALVAARAVVVRRARTVVVRLRGGAAVDDVGAVAVVIGGVRIVLFGATVGTPRDRARAVVDDEELAVIDGRAVGAAGWRRWRRRWWRRRRANGWRNRGRRRRWRRRGRRCRRWSGRRLGRRLRWQAWRRTGWCTRRRPRRR